MFSWWVYSTDRSKAVVPVLVLLSVALWLILRGDLFYVLPCVILFLSYSVFSSFSIAITSLGEERANLSVFRTFVRFALVWICRFPFPLGVWEGLLFVIVALPGLFSYLLVFTCVVCFVIVWSSPLHLDGYTGIQANSVHPDQTAPKGAVWSGSTLFAKMSFKITSRWQSRRQLLWLAFYGSKCILIR